ncbi:MAG: hypothetical protein K2H53_04490 [Clostridia bacterium]|nr:hypothetical protein [Clostridia bacterium]
MSFLCLSGKGTKISKYLIDHDKEYIATIKFGIRTTTGDREGEILEEKEVNINNLEEEKINNILQKFIGKQTQKPPIYSAIKVKRKKTI